MSMDDLKPIEDAPSFHARVMNLPVNSKRVPVVTRFATTYLDGHRDARHAAAEIANEADATIARLVARLRAAEADAERYRWLRDNAQTRAVIRWSAPPKPDLIDGSDHEHEVSMPGFNAMAFDRAIDAARSKT